jgi:hemoglobin
MKDITTRADLEHLLRGFYVRALDDPLLRNVFVDVMHMDLEAHLPRITDFWEVVLLRTGSYDGRAMEVHRRIHRLAPLTSAHFARWLELWQETVTACYAGPVAERAVAHATRMASGFLRDLTGSRPVRRPLPIVTASSS